MGKQVKLIHSAHEAQLDDVLANGLRAESKFQDFGLEMRLGVVFCWLQAEDDKLHWTDGVYLEVTVDQDRCLVADMEFISLAITYSRGFRARPANPEAAQLFAEIYRVTAVPLERYEQGMFSSPEVLVQGDIASDCIRVIEGHPNGAAAQV